MLRTSLKALTITGTAMGTETVINVAYGAVTAMNLSLSSYMVSPMIFSEVFNTIIPAIIVAVNPSVLSWA